jgi:hypothetical protein
MICSEACTAAKRPKLKTTTQKQSRTRERAEMCVRETYPNFQLSQIKGVSAHMQNGARFAKHNLVRCMSLFSIRV